MNFFWQVVEVAVISFKSKPEMDSSAGFLEDASHLLHYVGTGPTVDSEFGFQLQNLYDRFEIVITDTMVSGFIISMLIFVETGGFSLS